MSEPTAAPVAPAPAAPAPTAAPATETAAPEAAQPEAPKQEAQKKPESRRDARKGLVDTLRSKTTEAPLPAAPVTPTDVRPDAQGKLHGPDGKYVSPAGETEPQATAEPASTPAATAPEAKERIELAPDHPLRERGRQYVDELTPEEMKALANTSLRQREVEAARKEAEEARQSLIRLQAERDIYAEAVRGVAQDPTIAAQVDEIRRVWGDDAAKRYLAGIMQEYTGRTEERVQALEAERTQQEVQRQFTEFVKGAYGEVDKLLRKIPGAPVVPPETVQRWLNGFGSLMIAQGRENEATVEEFGEYAKDQLLRVPEVRDSLKRIAARQDAERRKAQEEEIRQQIETQRAAEEANRLRQAGQTRRTLNPVAQVPSAVQTGRTAGPEQTDLSKVPPHQLKRTLRNGLRDAIRFSGK